MVPLAEAWRPGGDTWTADRRKAFGKSGTGACSSCSTAMDAVGDVRPT
ncbi:MULTISPECIES: hypothetical protein [Streptomyces]|nr:hypothetical protein [Streptomyces sp. NEAU-HV9]